MKLYCMRHGDAAHLADRSGQRPLTALGQQTVADMALYLQQRPVQVAHVLRSNKLRAIQTAELLAERLANGQAIHYCPQLNVDATLMALMQEIAHWREDTLLVGHLPLIAELVSALVLGEAHSHRPLLNFPPATMVCLQRQDHAHWLLSWILRPDLLPQAELS